MKDNLSKIALLEITSIEARKNHFRVVYAGKESHFVRVTLKARLEVLPGDQIVMVYRSFVVARGKMASFDSKTFCLEGGKSVLFGDGYSGR